jgi:glycine cleavage system aminomethyltransferase T
VSSLAFLSPDAARQDLGFAPVLVSSMDRRLRDAGATFEVRDGWRVATTVPGEEHHLEHAGICDLSHQAKIRVRGVVPDPVLGETVRHLVTEDEALVLCPYRQGAAVRERLSERGGSVLDLTAAYAVLAIFGPQAQTVLRRMTHLHRFPASGDVSHVTAHVLVHGEAYWIVFPQEYGHYLWEVAVDAAEPLGGGPVGAEAIARRAS